MEAQVWMTGRVGGDVDVRDSTSPWSTFRLACTPRTVRGGEWGDEQTTWVTVSCSHRLAEHVRLSLRKGDPVVVVGKLRTRRWVDANGVEHEQLQIRASSVGHDLAVGTSSFYRPRRDGVEAAAAEAAEAAAESAEAAAESAEEQAGEEVTAQDQDEELSDPDPFAAQQEDQPVEPSAVSAEVSVATDVPEPPELVGEAAEPMGRRGRGRAA